MNDGSSSILRTVDQGQVPSQESPEEPRVGATLNKYNQCGQADAKIGRRVGKTALLKRSIGSG